jgi:hypothetical protein
MTASPGLIVHNELSCKRKNKGLTKWLKCYMPLPSKLEALSSNSSTTKNKKKRKKKRNVSKHLRWERRLCSRGATAMEPPQWSGRRRLDPIPASTKKGRDLQPRGKVGSMHGKLLRGHIGVQAIPTGWIRLLHRVGLADMLWSMVRHQGQGFSVNLDSTRTRREDQGEV